MTHESKPRERKCIFKFCSYQVIWWRKVKWQLLIGSKKSWEVNVRIMGNRLWLSWHAYRNTLPNWTVAKHHLVVHLLTKFMSSLITGTWWSWWLKDWLLELWVPRMVPEWLRCMSALCFVNVVKYMTGPIFMHVCKIILIVWFVWSVY